MGGCNFPVEAIDTTVLLDETLFAGVEGVAVGAGVNLDFAEDGASHEGGAAGGAGDYALAVIGVNVFLHFIYLLSPYGSYLKAATQRAR